MAGTCPTSARREADDSEWRRILAYGERRAREQGIGPDDVERLIDEYRAEADASRHEGRP